MKIKQGRELKGKELKNFEDTHQGLLAALADSLNGGKNTYYCDTCDGLRLKGHQCTCPFCKQSFPDSDKHKYCPILDKYKPKKEVSIHAR